MTDNLTNLLKQVGKEKYASIIHHKRTPQKSLQASVKTIRKKRLEISHNWGVGGAAVEQSRRIANMVTKGDGKFGPRG